MPMNKQILGNGKNEIYRVNDTVLRKGGVWSESVQKVLAYLHENGFAYSPKPLGVDSNGYEKQAYLPGESMFHPWKEVLLGEDGLTQVARMLRNLHDITTNLEMPENTIWRTMAAPKSRGQIIRHGDLGPWNTLWQGDKLTGIIDWEFTAPGNAITDLAQLAWYYIPLRDEAGWRKSGFRQTPDFKHRLEVICDVYGTFNPSEVVAELDRLQQFEILETMTRGGSGEAPWSNWLSSGQINEFRAENKLLVEKIVPLF